MNAQPGIHPLRRYIWLPVLAIGMASSMGAYGWLHDMAVQSVRHEITLRSKVKLDAIHSIFQQHVDTAMAINAFLKGEMGAHEYVEEEEAQNFAHAILDVHPDELAAIAIIPPENSGESRIIRQDGAVGLDPPLDLRRLRNITPGSMDIHPVQDRKRRWLTRLISSIKNRAGAGYAISDWNTTAMINIAIANTPTAGLDIEVGLIKNDRFTRIYRHRSRLRKATEEKETEETWQGGFSLNGIAFEVRTRATPAMLRHLTSTYPVWALLLGLALSLLLAYLAYNRTRYGEQLRMAVAARTAELSGEQKKLAAVIDHANEVVFLMDDAGNILRANPAASTLFGYAPEEWQEMDVHNLVPEEIRESHVRWFTEEIAGQRHDMMGKTRELKARRKDGTVFPCEVTVSEFVFGEAKRLSVILRDLTARKQHAWSQGVLLELRTACQQQMPVHARLQQMLDCMFDDPWTFLCHAGAIFLVEGEALHLAASHGWSEEDRERCAIVPFGECLCGKAIEAGEAIFHPHRPEEHRLLERGGPDAGYLCAPVMHGDERLGLINFKLKPDAAMPDAFHDFCRQAEEIIAGMLLRERTLKALEDSEYKYRSLVESSNAAAWQLDFTSGQFIYMGPQIEKLTGYPVGSWKDFDSWAARIHPEDREQAVQYCKTSSERGENHDFEYRVVSPEGKTVWIRDVVSVTSGEHDRKQLIGYMFDISERRQAEEKLAWLSYYDPLTELPNRRLFADRMKQALELARREKHSLALLFLDIDRFKTLNDSLGHSCGDQALKESARRLSGLLRSSDSPARMGGDEFAVLLPGSDANNARRVAEKVEAALHRPHHLSGQDIVLNTSIGIAIFPGDGEDSETLLMHADTAMYQAKKNPSHIHYFSIGMEEQTKKRLRMEQDLTKAADEDQLKLYFQSQHAIRASGKASQLPLHYQTKHQLTDGAIIGMEGLIRWQHPELGFISPTEFIPLAEETGLIRPITHWVLAEAGMQALTWEKAGIRPGRIGVNLSAIQLMQKGLAKEILEHIRETDANPEWIEIEITETAAMADPETAIVIMRELVNAGISIAIDDFGTGYSSLAYLKRLPAEWLKIDMAFIRNLPDDTEDAAIVCSTIAMAHALGMKTIAEGVETEAQLEFLRGEGCDAVQGYLFSKPLPADKASAHIRRNLKHK